MPPPLQRSGGLADRRGRRSLHGANLLLVCKAWTTGRRDVDPYNAPETAGETTCPYNGGTKPPPYGAGEHSSPLRGQIFCLRVSLYVHRRPLRVYPLFICAIVYKYRTYFVLDIDFKIIYNIFRISVVYVAFMPHGSHSMLINSLFYDIGYLQM